MQQIIIQDADDDIRLDRWFKRNHPGVPHALLEKFIRRGLVRLDGAKCKSSDRVGAGQTLQFPDEFAAMEKKDTPRAIRQISEQELKDIQKLVLYRDKDLLLLNKPSGLAVQGGSKQDTHLDALLDGLKFDASERPRLVHRLDKDTSGVLMLGRSANASARLSKLLVQKKIEKIYLALVKGVPKPFEDTIDLPLSKGVRGKHSRMEAYESMGVDEEEGQEALTEYRVVETLAQKFSWVELKPITGRTHQLRVHMAAIGHPIIGDGKYGGAEAFMQGLDIEPRLHLHAQRIIIPQTRGKALDITAPLPPHMRHSKRVLGRE